MQPVAHVFETHPSADILALKIKDTKNMIEADAASEPWRLRNQHVKGIEPKDPSMTTHGRLRDDRQPQNLRFGRRSDKFLTLSKQPSPALQKGHWRGLQAQGR